MSLSNSFLKSLPLAKRHGNADKLRRQSIAYKTARAVSSLQEQFEEHRYEQDMDEYIEQDSAWEFYLMDYGYWEEACVEDLPLVEMKQFLEHANVHCGPFAQLSGKFTACQHEDQSIELTRKINWYYTDASTPFNYERVTAQLKTCFRNDVPGAVLAAADRLMMLEHEKLQWLSLMTLFRPFWIRNLCSWPGGTPQSLLEHLFVRYPVPAFLFDEWKDVDETLSGRLVWNLWFIMIGQGVKLGRVFDGLGKKYDQCLMRVSTELFKHAGQPVAAATFAMAAEARRIGASADTVIRLARNPEYAQSPVDMTPAFREFFEGTVKWLDTHGSDLPQEQVSVVLVWAYHLHTERLRAVQQLLWAGLTAQEQQQCQLNSPACWLQHRKNPALFSWRGRTASSAAAAAQRYQQQLNRLRNAYLNRRPGAPAQISWEKKGLEYTLQQGDDIWTIVELSSARELAEEGVALAHCVASYVSRCVANLSAIFSLRKNGTRKITIELDYVSGRVLQARGRANREATPTENRVINTWRRQSEEPG